MLTNWEPVFLGQRQHLVVGIDTDDPSCWSCDLRRDVTNLPGAGSQVEHDIAFTHKSGRISAAIVAFFDFIRDDAEVLLVIFNRTTKLRLTIMRCLAVSFIYRAF